MLGKLIKHEFRATGRVMLPLFAVLGVLAVFTNIVVRLMMNLGNKVTDIAGSIIILLFAFAIAAVAIMSLVIMIQRFKNNLLSDEGYLMFTLPTSVHKIMWSKLIVSSAWFVFSGIAIAFSIIIAVFKVEFVGTFFDMISEIFESITAYYAINGVAVILELILIVFLSCTTCSLMFYAAMALGHSFDKKKTSMSVLFYIAFMVGIEIITSVIAVNYSFYNSFGEFNPMSLVHATLLLTALYEFLFSAVFYVITVLSLKKRLNLE